MFIYEVNVLNVNVFKAEWKRSSYWQSDSKKKIINQSVCLLSVCLSISVRLLILCVSVPPTDQKQICVPSCVEFYSERSSRWDAASCLPSECSKNPEIEPSTLSVGGHGRNYWTKSQADKTQWITRTRLTRQVFSYKMFQTLWPWWVQKLLTVRVPEKKGVWKTQAKYTSCPHGMCIVCGALRFELWDEPRRSGRKSNTSSVTNTK